MKEFMISGGLLFMSTITILLFVSVALAIIAVKNPQYAKLVKHAALLALMIGILAQLIGLFDIMNILEEIGSVSPALLAGGLKVSMIAPIYGVIVFTFINLLLLALGLIQKSKI